MLCVCLSHCSCFSLEYSLAYTTAFSRFSFIFCRYFFGCNPKRGGKLMSPVQLSFSSSIFVLLVTNDDKPHHFTQYKENNANRQLLKSRPSLAYLRVHAVPARSN